VAFFDVSRRVKAEHQSMSPELEGLVQLQRVDLAIEDARRKIAAHPQRLVEADARLQEAQNALEAARLRLKENQDARRTLEKDASVFQARLTKFKDQLYEVKTNREYQAMQKEIEMARDELGQIEEKVLERMIEADTLTLALKQAEAALATQQKSVQAEKATLGQELLTVETSLKEALQARSALMTSLQPRLLELFDQVSRMRKGVAICSATRDGLCSVCNVRLRPPVFQQVRHNDTIIQCESCQRILYYAAPATPAEPAPQNQNL
jgi:predicted  nucleic acid-binding Zn-ribbon protein